jgi:glycosyltransferase involved in cell wall biosynthesis
MIGDDSGILVPAGDMRALADAILRLAKDPELRRTMGAAAKERYEELFSPKVVVPLMVATYQRVMRNGHAVPETIAANGHLHPWAGVERPSDKTLR